MKTEPSLKITNRSQVIQFSLSLFGVCLSLLDVDECKNNSLHNCQQECVNKPGSFGCKCKSGFKLNNNGFACDGELDRDCEQSFI